MLQATLNKDTCIMEEILAYAHNTETPILSYNNEVELSSIVNLVYLSARDRYRVEREYKAAKKFKNENESRIRYLEKMIKTAVIISDDSKEDEVGMFNTVDVYFEDDDETETYKIVTTVRGNSLKNLISKESPLGAAIFGHKVGIRIFFFQNPVDFSKLIHQIFFIVQASCCIYKKHICISGLSCSD